MNKKHALFIRKKTTTTAITTLCLVMLPFGVSQQEWIANKEYN
jgi:hypothetical protein